MLREGKASKMWENVEPKTVRWVLLFNFESWKLFLLHSTLNNSDCGLCRENRRGKRKNKHFSFSSSQNIISQYWTIKICMSTFLVLIFSAQRRNQTHQTSDNSRNYTLTIRLVHEFKTPLYASFQSWQLLEKSWINFRVLETSQEDGMALTSPRSFQVRDLIWHWKLPHL